MAKKITKVQPFQSFSLSLPKFNLALPGFNLSFAHSWPFLALILAHILWGGNFLAAKLTLQEIPPMSLAFLRFFLALILLLPFLLADREKLKVSSKDLPQLILIGILMVTLHIAFFFEGLRRTTIIESSVLLMSIPFISILAGWWFLREKVYMINLAGVLVGLIGAVLIIGIPVLEISSTTYNPQNLIGNILIILSAITWVAGAIISKKMLKKYSTLTVTSLIFLVGVITFLIPAVGEYLKDPSWVSKISALGVLGLIYIATASSVVAYFLFEWGLGKVGVIKADLFQYIEPFIASALGILVLQEALHTSFLAGALLIGLGAYWGTKFKDEHKHRKAHRG